jgi:hypothetical protein
MCVRARAQVQRSTRTLEARAVAAAAAAATAAAAASAVQVPGIAPPLSHCRARDCFHPRPQKTLLLVFLRYHLARVPCVSSTGCADESLMTSQTPDTLRVPASPVWTMTMRSEAQRKPPFGMCGVWCGVCRCVHAKCVCVFMERERKHVGVCELRRRTEKCGDSSGGHFDLLHIFCCLQVESVCVFYRCSAIVAACVCVLGINEYICLFSPSFSSGFVYYREF